MTQISQAQLDREAVEIALWEAPSPQPDDDTIYGLLQSDSGNNTQGVGNHAAGDNSSLPELGPLSKFGSWESVGSTIIHKTVALSGFNPGSEKFDLVAWAKFLQIFSTIPFFLNYTFDHRKPFISKTSLKGAVDAVSDLLQNIMTPANFQGIVTTMKKIGQLALESEGKTQSNSNQQVGALARYNNTLYVGAIRTTVEMEYKKSKGHEQLNQTLTVYRGYGVLDFDKCKRNAEKLLSWDSKNVDDWEKGTASADKPPNDSPAWKN